MAPTFAVDEIAFPASIVGVESYADTITAAPRVDRRTAMQVPAVKRSRDLIAGTIGGLPLALYDANANKVSALLLEQPEKHRPRSLTMTQLVEDLFFEGVAWWLITEVGWHTYPVWVKRVAPRDVSVDETTGKVYVKGQHVPDSQLIRFDSPNDPFLVTAARSIRTALMLEGAVQRYADGAPPADYFEPTSDVDPFEDDDDAQEFLDGWHAARKKRSTAYIPFGLKYASAGFNPQQLELADAREQAALAIGNHAGIDPEAIGVSVTSRVYFNAEHKRKEFLDFVLGAYLAAIEGRLSMGDVSPRGYYAKFNVDAFLRSDTKNRMESYEIGLRVGAYTEDEVRALEDKPPLTPAQTTARAAQVRALPAPAEETSA